MRSRGARCSALFLLIAAAFAQPPKDRSGTKRTHAMTYLFSAEAVECFAGDYIVRRTPEGRSRVFRVDDLVFLSRLVPLRFPTRVELIEEKNTVDSRKPAYFDEIHVLLTAFGREYATYSEAVESIKANALGQGYPGLCLRLTEFPKAESGVYHAGK